MQAIEMIDRLTQLVNELGDFEVVPMSAIDCEPNDEGYFDDISVVTDINYSELPVEDGAFPCFLLNIE